MANIIIVKWDRRNFILILISLASIFILAFVLARTSTLVISPFYGAVCGKMVVIDAGHGGPDPGAVGKSGVAEKDIVLDIARRLERMLNRVAVYTIMTRRSDEVLVGSGADETLYWRRAELEKRMELANGSGADLFISLHANSFPEPVWSGAQTFYHPSSEESRLMAIAVQNELSRRLGPNLRRAKPGDAYFVLRNARMPAILIEVGFLSNPREEGLLGSPEYREKVAEAIFHGIICYLADRHKRETEGARNNGTGVPRKDRGKPEQNVERKNTRSSGENTARQALSISQNQVILYFAGPTNFDDSLLPEIRDMGSSFIEAPTEAKASMVARELISGPAGESMLCRTIPPGTTTEWISFSHDGTLSLSFGPELSRHHWGGSRCEELTVYSIVNTLCGIPGVKRVRLLIADKRVATIAGHIMLDEPFEMNSAIVESK
ncbi:MAG TPA: hypothetical protein GX509_06845 [Firmicutes bacterium]|nr:hypothetical protein [Bacillota bacterium]